MKRFNWLMAMLASVAVLFASCEETPTEPAPKPEPEPTDELTFDVKINEVTKTSFSFDVTPSDLEANYFIMVMDKVTVDEYTKDEYLVGTLNDELAAAAAKEGKTFEEYMASYVDKGALTDVSFSGLAMDTEYVLLIWGVDAANSYALCSEVSKTNFKTETIEAVDVTFEVKTSVYYNTVEFNVVPSNKEVRWHMMTLPKAAIDQYTDPAGDYQWSLPVFYQRYMQNTVEQYLGAGYTADQVISAMFPMGDQTMAASGLEANTEYMYLIAAVVIENGEIFIVTEPTSGTYTSEEALPSNMTFDISVTDIEQMRAAIKITPSNNDETFCWMVGTYDGTSAAVDIMNSICEQWGAWMSMMANYKGVQDYTGVGGSPYKYKLDSVDTEYYVIAFGYAGGVTTAPEMVTFRTLPSEVGPYNVEFDVKAGGVTPYGFTIAVIPNDDTVHYIVDAMSADAWNEAEYVAMVEEEIAMMYEQVVAFDPSTTMASLLSQYFWRGAQNIQVSGMLPETEVMGCVIALDYKTGKVSKVHTVNPLAKTSKLGSVTPNVEIIGCYSGDEEAGAVFGQPDATAGLAIAVVKYTGIENAKATYTTFIGGDFTSETDTPDPAFMATCSGYWSEKPIDPAQPYSFVTINWQEAYTAAAYSIDADGLIGKPSRAFVIATAENKRDIQELIDLVTELNSESTSAVRASVVYDEPVVAKAGVVSKPNNTIEVAPVAQTVEEVKMELPELQSNMLAPALDYIRPFYLHD